jgi:hypothetical protein
MSSAFVGPFDGSDVQSLSAELAFLMAMRENISCYFAFGLLNDEGWEISFGCKILILIHRLRWIE